MKVHRQSNLKLGKIALLPTVLSVLIALLTALFPELVGDQSSSSPSNQGNHQDNFTSNCGFVIGGNAFNHNEHTAITIQGINQHNCNHTSLNLTHPSSPKPDLEQNYNLEQNFHLEKTSNIDRSLNDVHLDLNFELNSIQKKTESKFKFDSVSDQTSEKSSTATFSRVLKTVQLDSELTPSIGENFFTQEENNSQESVQRTFYNFQNLTSTPDFTDFKFFPNKNDNLLNHKSEQNKAPEPKKVSALKQNLSITSSENQLTFDPASRDQEDKGKEEDHVSVPEPNGIVGIALVTTVSIFWVTKKRIS